MPTETVACATLKFLEDRWDSALASTLDEPELLRYRSNLLGSDLRITNFAGGNTSSKVIETDPLTGEPVEVLWVKGSGGDLGSIRRSGFATLYQAKLLALEASYRGVEFEDEMAEHYPLAAFRANPVAASIDTPLHGFLPFKHVDHLHPDWAIALAASANGSDKMAEFNREFDHRLVWLPWQRPGFELAMMMKRVVLENPGCDGIVLGGHGLFTWGESQRESYLSTITTIDQLGQFIARHRIPVGAGLFGGQIEPVLRDRRRIAVEILPFLRGKVGAVRRSIASYSDSEEVLGFVNSVNGQELAFLGTSCPDHFIRTKIRPMFVPWSAASGDLAGLRGEIVASLATYREDYQAYYRRHALPDSPAIRDASPSVVLVPGVGMFSFGKNKTEARIIGEFYTNAIHVMEGASVLGHGLEPVATGDAVPQAGPAAAASEFSVCTNYVALPPSEAFRIEYWALEEAKIRRQPPEKELSRKVVLVVGVGGEAGREVARMAAERGAHVVVADGDLRSAERVSGELRKTVAAEFVLAVQVDVTDRESIRAALDAAVRAFGGVDILVDTAELLPGLLNEIDSDSAWSAVGKRNGGRNGRGNATGNDLLAGEVEKLFAEQDL